MKLSHYLIFLAASSLCISSYLSIAQDDPFADSIVEEKSDGKHRQIRFYTESFELSALEYAKLMTITSEKTNHNELRNALLAKAKAGEAVLISNHAITSISGERSTIESVKEFIYAIDDDFEIPAEFLAQGGGIFLSHPATPTSFQTHNLGTTYEFEPILSESHKFVDLYINFEIAKHIGDHVVSTTKTSYAESKESRPIFQTNRLKTSVTLLDGEFMLVNTFSPELDGEIDHSRKILNFVRVDILGFDE